MMTYYRTDDQVIHEEEKLSDGVWVQMINPTHDECEEIAEKLMVDIDDVKAALDVEESSRIELAGWIYADTGGISRPSRYVMIREHTRQFRLVSS